MCYDDPMENVAIEPPGLEDDEDFLQWLEEQPAQRLFTKTSRARMFGMVMKKLPHLSEDPQPIGNTKAIATLIRGKKIDEVIKMLS